MAIELITLPFDKNFNAEEQLMWNLDSRKVNDSSDL